MAWAPLLLTLLTYCSGSLSQFTLTQPPSMSVSLGNTVQLSCTISSGKTIIYASWYQQKIGNSPKYLLWYKSSAEKHQGAGVPSRFSASKDASNKTISLTISNVQADDEADYYCGAWRSCTHDNLVVAQQQPLAAQQGNHTKRGWTGFSQNSCSVVVLVCTVPAVLKAPEVSQSACQGHYRTGTVKFVNFTALEEQ
uniref:Ig-like domain-containing protein n=1 Tax=Pelusios castaneus TaxID=367368 RepID=A0A8C8SAL0_9SAUR